MYIFIIFILSLLFPTTSFSQEITATPTKAPNKEVLEMVQQKVKDMLQQNGSETSDTSSPKSFIGTIAQIDNNQITINYKNESKIFTVTEETVVIDAKRNKKNISTLKDGQDILAMGYFNEYNNFEAKRIVITDLEAAENKNEVVLGKIVDISQSSPIFVLIPIKNKDNQYQIKTDSKTEILDKDNNELTISKLKSGQKIVAIIQPDAKMAKTFYVSKIITLDSPDTQTTPTPTDTD
jgi:ribosome maturation factor RimP